MPDRPLVLRFPEARLAPPKTGGYTAPSEKRFRCSFDQIVESWQGLLRKNERAKAYLQRRKLWVPDLLERLQVGFAESRRRPLPESPYIRRLLVWMKILDRNEEHLLHNRLVVPIFDEQDFLAGAYGVSLDETSPVPDLYPAGTAFGVFNTAGIPADGEVIVTASILDALTLLTLGFPNVTCALEPDGQFGDLGRVVRERSARRVVCAYPIDADERPLWWTAQGLARAGIPLAWAQVPGRGLNTLVVAGATRTDIQTWIDEAVPMAVRRGPGSM